MKEFDNGKSLEKLVCSYGISRTTVYNWQKSTSRIETSEMEREAENTLLKRMYVNLAKELDVDKYKESSKTLPQKEYD